MTEPISPALYKRRDHLEVLAQILEVCKKPLPITYIMINNRLCYRDIKNYCNQLAEKGLLQIQTQNNKPKTKEHLRAMTPNPRTITRRTYTTTNKGKKFLSFYKELRGLLS